MSESENVDEFMRRLQLVRGRMRSVRRKAIQNVVLPGGGVLGRVESILKNREKMLTERISEKNRNGLRRRLQVKYDNNPLREEREEAAFKKKFREEIRKKEAEEKARAAEDDPLRGTILV